MKSPKRPPKTAEESALEIRQQRALDKEIEEEEERLSLFTRRSLGKASLLTGAPKTTAQAAGGTRSGFGGRASLMGGTGVRSSLPTNQRNFERK